MTSAHKPIKIVLISPYEEIHSCGVRAISSYLKNKGIRVKLIFCPTQSRFDAYFRQRSDATLPDTIVNDIARLAHDATCIGISLMTDHFNGVASLTGKLKLKLPDVPVLWGGIHPTILPEECTYHADYVCIGEGYEPTYELLLSLDTGERHPKISGICYRRNNEYIYNHLRPPMPDVDVLPFMDYGIDDHFMRKGDAIVPMTPSLLKRHLGFWYTSFFTHGCPFSCSFCCNSVFHKLDSGYRKIRKHSPEYIAEEIKYVRKLHPFIKMVKFNDDCIMSLTESEMERFADLQDQNGRTPFVATGMNPSLVTEQKVATLVRAGLKRARIGIQTGSEKISREIYNRKNSNDNIVRASEILSKFSKQIVPTSYDIILDNPWETPENLVDTYSMIRRLKRPFVLNIYSLTLYPNTEIYRKAHDSNIPGLSEESLGYSKNFLDWSSNFLNCLIALQGIVSIPSFISKSLLRSQMAKDNPTIPAIFKNMIIKMSIVKKAFLHVSKRDITMLPYAVARLMSYFLK
jgi:anaerobic magnesium-protoporphyrin IX monomethyl ester cyclase